MKIVCDACSAKYSIADDKVKGKVFKIRCKKCSNIIVVRGTAGAGGAEEPAAPQFDQKDTRVYDYGYDEGAGAAPGGAPAGEEPVWHLVIDQEQIGPLTVAEVQQRFAAGEIDAESYVWREGFADWQPLSAVDAFAGVVAGGGGAAAAASSGGSGRDAVASMFGAATGDEQGTVRSDPGDLFGAPARDEGGASDDAGDLFGARAAASSSSGSASTSAEPRARRDSGGASGGKLRGERNENSVLFSLGNLAALASDAPRASAASSSSSSSSSSSASGAAQHGGGEGSGLIDIRSMASAYLGPQGAAKKQASTVGSIDDLPVFTSSSFAEPAVIMPGPAPRQNNKTMVILIAAVGALAVITLILVLVVVLGGGSKSSPQTAGAGTGATVATSAGGDKGSNKTPTGAELAAGSGSDSGSAGTAAEAGSGSGSTAAEAGSGSGSTAAETGTGSGSAKSGSDKGSKSSSDKGDKHSSDKHSSDKGSSDKGSSDKGSSDKGSTDKGAADTGGKCPDEVGCLLAEKPPACCSKYSKGKKGGGSKSGGGDSGGGDSGGGGGDLPETLDSGMIKAGVGKVKSKIFACGDKYPNAKGTLKLSVKVSAAGKVTDASAVQSPDPGLGSCAASAVKGATFDKTQRGGSFKYPFNF